MGRKTTDGYFKKETLRETESLQITAQNNDIRTNYIEVKISYTQQNS